MSAAAESGRASAIASIKPIPTRIASRAALTPGPTQTDIQESTPLTVAECIAIAVKGRSAAKMRIEHFRSLGEEALLN